MENFKISKLLEDTKDVDPFRKTGRVVRSPPAGKVATISKEQNTPVGAQSLTDPKEKRLNEVQRDMTTPEDTHKRQTDLDQLSSTTYSPRLEQIRRMREIEEESIRKCVAILRSMGQAIERQKNISKDVKDGVSVLNEQFDVIKSCRRSWKELESARHLEAQKVLRESSVRNEVDVGKSHGVETPVTVRTRRISSSPNVSEPSRKVRENGQESWQTVSHRKNNKKSDKEEQTAAAEQDKGKKGAAKKRTKPKRKIPEAILVKPREGKTYAEVLRDLRNKVKPEEAKIAIRSVRKTKSGSILLELAEGGSKDKFCNAIKTSLKDAVNVSSLTPRTTIEIRDLDALSESDEVSAAVKELIQSPDEDVHVRITKANSREQRRAFITLTTEKATKILNSQKVKIGWTYCRVRRAQMVQRCFKCFGMGHTQHDCKGPDRKGRCIRCGESGHIMKDCNQTPRCCICVEKGERLVDHIPGTSRCPSYMSQTRSK